MKRLIVALLLLGLLPISFAASASFAETVSRLDGEDAENFARRNGPAQSETAHSVIETAWGAKTAVIAFYETEFKEAGPGYTQVIGYVFMPQAGNIYHKILIDAFEPEGDNPKIESVFFANADADPARELIVICSWPQRHADVSGTLYGTFMYKTPTPEATKLVFLKDVSKLLDGGCECKWSDGRKEKAKYKTAGEVKAGLKKLGFSDVSSRNHP